MNTPEIQLTIVGIQQYQGRFPFSGGRQLICAKEPDNKFDNKAIKVLDVGNTKVGYIANSPYTVIEGTMSASQVYDQIGDYSVIEVVHSTEYNVICKVIEADFKIEKLIKSFTTDRYDPEYPFTDIYPPECPYPFDYCEFPFEYNLIGIDLTDECIPYEWRLYLICCELGIDEQQMNRIKEMEDAAIAQDQYYPDLVEILLELKNQADWSTETIAKIIQDCCLLDEPGELPSGYIKEIHAYAVKIGDVLNQKY